MHHNAGNDGMGGASYIDSVWLRDRDMTNGWAGGVDGNLEERTFYCQNWRADVVAVLSSSGQQVQQVRYGEYGEAFGMPKGDVDGDGDVNNGDTADTDQIQTWIIGLYNVRGDLDLDGDVDTNDKNAALAMGGTVLGWGNLSLSVGSSGGGNRKGYAGYENDGILADSQFYHVRNRVYHAGLGRWLTRDPLAYIDGPNLFTYVNCRPVDLTDFSGTVAVPIGPYYWLMALSAGCPNVPVVPGTDPRCIPLCTAQGGGAAGRSGCDGNGNRISCNCIPYWVQQNNINPVPAWLAALSACTDRCEGCHQANYTCPPTGIFPIWNGPDPTTTHHCSECGVIGCASLCFSQFNCQGDADCIANQQNLRNSALQHCQQCHGMLLISIQGDEKAVIHSACLACDSEIHISLVK